MKGNGFGVRCSLFARLQSCFPVVCLEKKETVRMSTLWTCGDFPSGLKASDVGAANLQFGGRVSRVRLKNASNNQNPGLIR